MRRLGLSAALGFLIIVLVLAYPAHAHATACALLDGPDAFREGKQLLEDRRCALATVCLEKAIRSRRLVTDDEARAYALLSQCAFRIGKLRSALEMLKRSERIAPDLMSRNVSSGLVNLNTEIMHNDELNRDLRCQAARDIVDSTLSTYVQRREAKSLLGDSVCTGKSRDLGLAGVVMTVGGGVAAFGFWAGAETVRPEKAGTAYFMTGVSASIAVLGIVLSILNSPEKKED